MATNVFERGGNQYKLRKNRKLCIITVFPVTFFSEETAMNFSENEFERLIDFAVQDVIEHEDFAHLSTGIKRFFTQSHNMPNTLIDMSDSDSLASVIALTLWNAMPLPSNNYRPAPIDIPGRNQKCFCDSGKKAKHCCLPFLTGMPPIEENMIWPILLDFLPEATLKASIKDRSLPLDARVYYATECLADNRTDQVLLTLEDDYWQDSFKDTGNIGALGLITLFDTYTKMGQQKKKMDLIQHICDVAPASELRSEALQRLATIQMDNSMFDKATKTLIAARRDDPKDPGVDFLEIQLLLLTGKHQKAQMRARFLRKRLQKINDDTFENPMLDLLTRIIEDPQEATVHLLGDNPVEETGLPSLITESLKRPIPSCRYKELTGFTDNQMNNPTDDRPQFILESTKTLQKIERKWKKISPVDPPFSIQMEMIPNDDPWQPDTVKKWETFLIKNPKAFDSIPILDELLGIVELHPDWGHPAVMDRMYFPLLERSGQLIEKAISGIPEEGCLPWICTENRPLLRTLLRQLSSTNLDVEQEFTFNLMVLILQLNPNDNFGLRSEIMNMLLAADENLEALSLADRYPDDAMADILYGRVLALYRLNRKDEALEAAAIAKRNLPKVMNYLIAPSRKDPGDDTEYGMIYGGKQEAWEYREGMRDIWKRSRGIFSWLKTV